MATDNPSNPYTRDPGHIQKDVPMPIQKAKVLAAGDQPEDNAFHTVKIRVYGDQAPYIAPVLAPMFGSVWVPSEGTDVAVVFGNSDKPWVIGAWYPLDRVEDGEVDLPDYEAGDMRIGNETGSHVTVHNDGHISIISDKRKRVDIDHQSAATYLDTDQSIAGDSNYHQVQFDTEEDDPEDLFDPSTHSFTIRHKGRYEINSTIEIPLPGQGNVYTIAIFVDGALEKRKSRQSAVNEPLSVDVELDKKYDGGEEVDIRLKHNRGSSSTVQGSQKSSAFNIHRTGI